MKIFPAIDIIEGRVVRLTRGDYGVVKKYAASPLEAAEEFYRAGARYLHVVDLDGARSGRADNAQVIEEIVKRYSMFVEVGGGIRSRGQIERYLSSGVGRVIIGTAAVKDEAFTVRAATEYGDKIAVGVDAKQGKVAVSGWEELTSYDSVEFCKRLQSMGVKNIIYTDISKDGCLNGTNLDIYKVLCQTLSLNITASGGITYIDEIKKLKEMGLYAAVLGKAVYEGKLSLKEALAAAEDSNAG